MSKRATTSSGSRHNAAVNHPMSSFGMSGERSYLPDTGSRARNNKRILGIEPARPSGTGAPTARRRIRGGERNKKKRRGGGRKRRRRRKPGRRLRCSRSCSALRRRARESALYLTPNQLRSAVPDKILSLFSLHLSPLNGAQP